MTPMSWAATREALESHSKAISQLYVNCDALKTAIGGQVVGDTLTATPTLPTLSLLGRLKWLLTGKVA
jgi:hypothetical protein